MSDKRISTCVRFPPEMHERLTAEAEARDVSVNWLVNRLVAEGLERITPAEEFRLFRLTTVGGAPDA